MIGNPERSLCQFKIQNYQFKNGGWGGNPERSLFAWEGRSLWGEWTSKIF
ncbi:MAG: hypothetical protein J7647_27845 [Cyanobacteria bacterium SBLK]|nr:hypothetical protein [Cyanobacteria bacterium SBLK]